MTGNLLNQGLMLMVFGMGTVFVFLAVLVVSTAAMSQIIAKYFPKPETQPATAQGNRSGQPDTQFVSVVMAAIHQYRKDKKKSK